MLGLSNIKSPPRGAMEDPIITTEDIVIAPGVRETASEDGAVLLDIEQGICFSLNPVGLKIWELLEEALIPSIRSQTRWLRISRFHDPRSFPMSLNSCSRSKRSA